MTQRDKMELIDRVSKFLYSIRAKWTKSGSVSGRFLQYLASEKLITDKEIENIERFHRLGDTNIIYYSLINELYNKHIKQLENGTKPELDKEST